MSKVLEVGVGYWGLSKSGLYYCIVLDENKCLDYFTSMPNETWGEFKDKLSTLDHLRITRFEEWFCES